MACWCCINRFPGTHVLNAMLTDEEGQDEALKSPILWCLPKTHPVEGDPGRDPTWWQPLKAERGRLEEGRVTFWGLGNQLREGHPISKVLIFHAVYIAAHRAILNIPGVQSPGSKTPYHSMWLLESLPEALLSLSLNIISFGLNIIILGSSLSLIYSFWFFFLEDSLHPASGVLGWFMRNVSTLACEHFEGRQRPPVILSLCWLKAPHLHRVIKSIATLLIPW